MIVFFIWLGLAWCIPLHPSAVAGLPGLLASAGILSVAPISEAELAAYDAERLAVAPPDCPATAAHWSCDASGRVDSLTLNALTPAGVQRRLDVPAAEFFAATVRIWVENWVGDLDVRFAFNVTARNVTLTQASGSTGAPLPFFLMARHMQLENVSVPWALLAATDRISPITCRFDAVLLRCPIPADLLRCFPDGSNATCLSAAPPFLALEDERPCTAAGDACTATCLVPPAPTFACFTSTMDAYFPATPGVVEVDFVLRTRSFVRAVQVGGLDVVGLVNRVALFDWRTREWVTVWDLAAPTRSLSAAGQVIVFAPVLTNRARVTLELWLESRHRVFSFLWTFAQWPMMGEPATQAPQCADATTISSRSMLDETLADSFCLGRLCQLACAYPAANFTFRAMRAEFLVIDGDGVWSSGRLVATTSARTRVYELDGSIIDKVEIDGVRDVRRVRLVGSPVSGGLPLPTLPNRIGLPGVLVKRLLLTRGAIGGVVVGAGNVAAPAANETIVSAVTVLNQTFVTTASGRLWRRGGDGGWSEVAASDLTAFVLNGGEPQPARKLVAVGERLVAVVAAHTILHDGSAKPLLVNRRVVQTAIDVLDVASGVWYNEVLAHGVERNVSDVDVVVWNATAFGVVDRASGATAAFEWRAFAYELRRCAANNDCQACLTSEANEEPCRWCGTRCVTRQASCMGDETSVVNASAASCTGRTATGTTTAVVVATNATTAVGSTLSGSTNASALPLSSGASLASLPPPSSSSATVGLAVGIPVALLAVGGLAAGLFFWSRRKRAAERGGDVELPPQEKREEVVYEAFEPVPVVASPVY